MSRTQNVRPIVDLPPRFLKTSGTALAGATLLSAIAARSYAGRRQYDQVALVGCGGRGTGARPRL